MKPGNATLSAMFTPNFFTALVLALAVALPAAAQTESSPNDVITSAIDELSQVLDGRQEELANDPAELRRAIDPILLPRFDRKYAAQLVLGRHWREATPAQRERFIEAFYAAMLRKYADGVTEFDADKVQVLNYRGDTASKRTTVRTMVTLDDGTETPVNYGLVKRDDGWKIFDVTIEGVSYIRNFRAELDSEISSSSLEEVIARYESDAGSDGAADDGDAASETDEAMSESGE
jgi:phospholipid transport system substrate-binding protein